MEGIETIQPTASSGLDQNAGSGGGDMVDVRTYIEGKPRTLMMYWMHAVRKVNGVSPPLKVYLSNQENEILLDIPKRCWVQHEKCELVFMEEVRAEDKNLNVQIVFKGIDLREFIYSVKGQFLIPDPKSYFKIQRLRGEKISKED